MKKTAGLLFFLVLFYAYAQRVQDNPEQPLSKDHGRTLRLTEVIRIDGEGEGYYFNGANELLVDLSGNIYIRDVWSSRQRAHLPVFSSDGRFIKDLYRHGEGPGEIASAYDFALSGSKIYIFDYSKRKIVEMNIDGTFIQEFKVESESFNELIGVFEDWLVFLRTINPYERRTSRLYDVKNVVAFISKAGQKEKDFYTFLNQQFFISSAQGGGGMSWDPFISVMGDDGQLFVCSSQEYCIEVLDLKTGKIAVRMKRKYPRVRYEMKDWEPKFISKYNAPKKRFEPDIEALFYDRGQIWVQTSKKEEGKGQLFDVFDLKGRFLDSFFIPIKGRIVKIDGDFLFAAEADKDFLPYVAKYRID